MTAPTTPCLSERVIASIVTLPKAVRVADGYETDAGLNVFRARSTIDPRKVPCFNIWEGQEQPSADSKGKDNRKQHLLIHIEGHATADQDDTGVMLGKLKADAKRAICGGSNNGGVPDPPNPRPFAIVDYDGSIPTPRPDGANTESVTLIFSINYPEAYGDPYTTG